MPVFSRRREPKLSAAAAKAPALHRPKQGLSAGEWPRNSWPRALTGCFGLRGDPLDKLRQPLSGKRIVVTRAARQAQELRRSLEDMGAEVLLMPTVSFLAPEDGKALDSALGELLRFDWVLFTSQNAVGFFIKRCRELGLDRESFDWPKPLVAVVGPATAQVATERGLRVSFVATEHTGEGLARELRILVDGGKVLLPRSDRGDDRLLNALR